MKNAKTIIALLIFFIIVSIAAGYAAGFFVYREYQQKTALLEREAAKKFSEVEEELKELYLALETSMDESKAEREKALAIIEGVKEGIEDWEKEYVLVLTELRETIDSLKVQKLTRMVENLQDDIDRFKVTMQDLDMEIDEVRGANREPLRDIQGIDLGRISVKK